MASVELDEARVLRVRQRWDDPTWDGALVGFTAGSAPSTGYVLPVGQSEGPSSGPAFAGMMMLAGALGIAGGLVGATLDGSRTRETELYRRPVSVSPLLSQERVGAVLSISW